MAHTYPQHARTLLSHDLYNDNELKQPCCYWLSEICIWVFTKDETYVVPAISYVTI